jgi:hypothetical protein
LFAAAGVQLHYWLPEGKWLLAEQAPSSGASAGSSDSGMKFIMSHCGGGSVAVSLLCVQQPAANGLLQHPDARHVVARMPEV